MNLSVLALLFIAHSDYSLSKQVLVSFHLIASLITTLVSYSVAVMLIYFVRRRANIPFAKILLLVSVFLFCCGTLNVLEVQTIGHFDELAGVKIVAIGIFIITAIALLFSILKALFLNNTQPVITLKKESNKQIERIKRVNDDAHTPNHQLENRIKERTLELKKINKQLIKEIKERKQIEAALQHELRLKQLIISLSTQFHSLSIVQGNPQLHDEMGSTDRTAMSQNHAETLKAKSEGNFQEQPTDRLNFLNIDSIIKKELQTISDFTEVDKTYLFLFSQANTQIPNIYQAVNFQTELVVFTKKETDLEQNLPWIVHRLEYKQIINLPNIDNLPSEANKDKNYLRQQNIKSLLMLPMFYGGLLVGLLGFGSVSKEREWKEGDIQLLSLAGEIFINAIERCRQQEQLILRTQELESSNQELQQFTQIVSHDLQEPLRAISSYTELLEEEYGEQLDAEAQEYIQFVVGGARRMTQLIQDLLIFSRVGRQPQNFSLVSCGDVLQEVVANLKIAIDENNAVITWDRLPQVIADKSMLIQLWQNLIANSLKFRSQEPPKINISATTKGKEFIFCLQDNGIGIDPKHAERIFVIFQRLHTRRTYPGTGIGLAICKKIVELHQGKIWVESALGAGAAFNFSLPIRN